MISNRMKIHFMFHQVELLNFDSKSILKPYNEHEWNEDSSSLEYFVCIEILSYVIGLKSIIKNVTCPFQLEIGLYTSQFWFYQQNLLGATQHESKLLSHKFFFVFLHTYGTESEKIWNFRFFAFQKKKKNSKKFKI